MFNINISFKGVNNYLNTSLTNNRENNRILFIISNTIYTGKFNFSIINFEVIYI